MRKLFLPIAFCSVLFVSASSPAFSQEINSSSGAGVMSAATKQMRLDFTLTQPVAWQDIKLPPGAYYARFDAGRGGRPIILILRPKDASEEIPVEGKKEKVKELRVATSMVDEAHKGDQPQMILDQKGRVCKLMLPGTGLRLMFCSLNKKDPGVSLPLSETYAPVMEP